MRGHERTAESHAIKLKGKRHLLSMRHVVTKMIRKLTYGLNESKDPYLRSITHIHMHIPMYVSKGKIFILLTSANYWSIYLIDFTNMWTHTRANNPIFIQLTMTVFLIISIPILLWLLNCLFLNIRCCHIPLVYVLVKFVLYLWWNWT